MTKRYRLHLFEGYGVELEYMIVDQQSLDIRSVADTLLRNEKGEVEGELEFDETARSNELVSHVIEIKSNGPKSNLKNLSQALYHHVKEINQELKPSCCHLLPTAAHPWMNPQLETKLWEHESQEIYRAYDRIFNCKGHGWSNLQSTHINFPFYDDEEFAKLHTAIRFLMPIIPALTASSPILDSKYHDYIDRRLYYYEKNQASMPVIGGRVIPDRFLSHHSYRKQVYQKIAEAIKLHDPEGILDPVWVNSRGALPRFDRGTIEIRIIDVQECVKADLAIVALITTLVKMLVKGDFIAYDTQLNQETKNLYQVYQTAIKSGSKPEVDKDYLKAWGLRESKSYHQLWKYLFDQALNAHPNLLEGFEQELEELFTFGNLSERILARLNGDFSREKLQEVYGELAICLEDNRIFTP